MTPAGKLPFELWGHIGFAIMTGAGAIAISLVLFIYLKFFYVDIPRISNIPEIPNGNLLSGHLYKLGSDHATTAEEWSKNYRWPVFQIRMGRRRAIILNSFDASRDWMVKHQSATLDRPWFYTFHGVISATSGRHLN